LLCGDVNFDGLIDVVDTVLTKQYIVGLIPFDSVQLVYADVNHDGLVNALDIVTFKRHLLGVELIEQIHHGFDWSGVSGALSFVIGNLISLIHFIMLNPVLFLGLAMWVIGGCISFFRYVSKF